jgi:hypothetical protein
MRLKFSFPDFYPMPLEVSFLMLDEISPKVILEGLLLDRFLGLFLII